MKSVHPKICRSIKKHYQALIIEICYFVDFVIFVAIIVCTDM